MRPRSSTRAPSCGRSRILALSAHRVLPFWLDTLRAARLFPCCHAPCELIGAPSNRERIQPVRHGVGGKPNEDAFAELLDGGQSIRIPMQAERRRSGRPARKEYEPTSAMSEGDRPHSELASIVGLVGAILLKQNDEWAVQRRYSIGKLSARSAKLRSACQPWQLTAQPTPLGSIAPTPRRGNTMRCRSKLIMPSSMKSDLPPRGKPAIAPSPPVARHNAFAPGGRGDQYDSIGSMHCFPSRRQELVTAHPLLGSARAHDRFACECCA